MKSATEVFGLTPDEAESLANKAGLSLRYSSDFTQSLLTELEKSEKRQKDILESANVSERMFEYIKNGLRPSKETLLALVITSGLQRNAIQTLLTKAGYILSRSLPGDVVVLHFLDYGEHEKTSMPLLMSINHVLEDLGLPLLMTRQRFL